MQVIWNLERAFVKEVRDEMPDPKLHVNTVSTMMKRLVEKGFLSYEDFGATYRYYPIISKKDYTARFISPELSTFFGGSIKDVVAFFAEEQEISVDELKEVIRMIEKKDK